nr:unnamed protein product [Callosobruchus chinensis]
MKLIMVFLVYESVYLPSIDQGINPWQLSENSHIVNRLLNHSTWLNRQTKEDFTVQNDMSSNFVATVQDEKPFVPYFDISSENLQQRVFLDEDNGPKVMDDLISLNMDNRDSLLYATLSLLPESTINLTWFRMKLKCIKRLKELSCHPTIAIITTLPNLLILFSNSRILAVKLIPFFLVLKITEILVCPM